MNIKALALTALAATTVGFGAVPKAQAACYPSTAVNNMNTDAAGGATIKQAWQWAVEDGTAENTERCRTRVIGYARKYAEIKPYFWRAINQ